jgi:hypothetical protein
VGGGWAAGNNCVIAMVSMVKIIGINISERSYKSEEVTKS